jgi:hypothetical protein
MLESKNYFRTTRTLADPMMPTRSDVLLWLNSVFHFLLVSKGKFPMTYILPRKSEL